MKNLINFLVIFVMLASCHRATLPKEVAYEEPHEQYVECYSANPDPVSGQCDDTKELGEFLEEYLLAMDVKTLRHYETKEEAINLVKSHFPQLRDRTDWQTRTILPHFVCLANLSPFFEYIKYKSGVPKYVIVSSFVNETGWGQSRAWLDKLNPGGIGGDKSLRSYSNLLEAANDWSRVLSLPRYIDKVKDPTSPKSWFKAYERGKYWSAPSGYRDRVTVVAKWELTRNEDYMILPPRPQQETGI